MQKIANLKLHLLALIVVVIAEAIGTQKVRARCDAAALLFALGYRRHSSVCRRLHILNTSQMDRAAKFMPIAMLVLIAKIGLDIGPNLEILLNSGWALIMQEFGHFFGTLIFGLPVALLLKMKREAIGACYSIDREANVAIIGEKFGLDSAEGRG